MVRVDAVSMRDRLGGDGRPFGSGGATNNDDMRGEVVVLRRHGETFARHPQISALPASWSDAWYDPDWERRRLTALSAHFAGWLRRGM